MITTVINKHKVELYDSIDNMPIVNFHLFNKFMLIDSGIGSNFSDIDSHIVRIAKLINKDKALAIQELQNMRQLMHMITENINPKLMSFACFIHSIDGNKFYDLTDTGILNVINKINGEKVGTIDNLLTKLKKKLTKN